METKKTFAKIILLLLSLIGTSVIVFFVLNPFAFDVFTKATANKIKNSCKGVSENNLPDPQYPEYKNIRSVYAKGKDAIYAKVSNSYGMVTCYKIESADYSTFEVISSSFAKDKNHVYLRSNILRNADPLTFEVIKYSDGNYSDYEKDSKNVYYEGRLIDKADPETIEVMYGKYCLAKDKNYVFQCGNIKPDINPKTFQPEVNQD